MSKKGYKQTEEHKRKISLANINKKKSKTARENMSITKKKNGTKPPSNIGKKFSKEHRERISRKMKGKNTKKRGPLTDKHRENVSKSLRGKKGSNWQGGKTKQQKIIRSSFLYRQWRSDVFTRDDFTCQNCGLRGCYLEAHHIKPFSLIITEYNIKNQEDANNCSELWNINNGVTLCRKCHDKTKKGAEIWKK